ncbi:DUF2017 domain-containing protein [Corynebacterium bovis]|uniref:DUF2017 domain-containing protein n=2 Tax=Corynebacterium bovis TaxID=36808 RepID=A0A426QAL5_9CORY|nr:DUF2017 domain-containing protein [Corynebacterium bovis]MBB3114815.1 hypothetical protein [Corynebacterium bovis DSM 20582 = CIP 54.80]MBB3115269.1 hypothetical protein [Corynebacterium bovis DSM 20582 = CIP 54.80]MDH2456184.1 DUF2017 domain-containing protein [Corynebacterium bovis]MDN8579781.1 DUF2017 domain-containing protein [Corynebacterium bovis]QQC48169.1 DUF2017 domain-containing protein [Corynebacterium bovis]
MKPWTRKSGIMRGTRFQTVLEPLEREMLGDSAATISDHLMERVRTAPKDELSELTGMTPGHAEPPADPGLARLLPSFFREGDEEVEGEAALTRQLTETDIIREKLRNLRLIGDRLGPDGSVAVTLGPEEARVWLGAVNDVRNYHAAQLDRFREELGPDSEQVQAADNYLEWLGFHQDSLLTAMMGELP